MRKAIPLIVLLIGTMCLNLSCKKEKLTKATETGANTFSCKVDGKVFLPKKSASWFGGEPVFVSNLPGNGFVVKGDQNNGSRGFSYSISIVMPYLTQTGTYELSTYPYGMYDVRVSTGPRYMTNATHTGTVTITRCDLTNRIYSGTFAFTAVDDSTGKVITITKGRFDVKEHR